MTDREASMPEPPKKGGRGRPRRVGGALPTMTFRLTDGSKYHLDAIGKLFPDINQSSLLRTVWDLAVLCPQELEEEIKSGHEDRGPLGELRMRLGLSTLSTPFPSTKGAISFRVEPAQQTQYKDLIGERSSMLVFEAALRLFRRKTSEQQSPVTGQ